MHLLGLRRIWIATLSIVVVGTAGAIALVGSTMSVLPPDPIVLTTVANGALRTNNELTALPPGLRPGHINDEDRQRLRASINARFARDFAGAAFTNRLNGLLAWADRISTDPTQPRVLSADLINVHLDPPVVRSDVATLTGVYDLVEKQAYDTPLGVTATFGGTFTNSFVMQLERRGSTWLVTAFSEQPVGFVRDPSMESNLDVDPNPGATKPPVDTIVPFPIDPAPAP